MAKINTIIEVLNSRTLDEATDIAGFLGGTPQSGKVTLTQYALGNGMGQGVQITTSAKNFVQLDKSGATRVGKMLTKWALTQ